MIRTGNVDSLFYVCTDHLGSITALVNEQGTVVERHSYDAWGRERNPNDWSSYTVTPGRLDRGFTGHEAIREFGLINMNGRVYDPILGRMLSPDNEVQDPFDSQNLNRYTYCLNNPLLYTDPTGNTVLSHFLGWVKKNTWDAMWNFLNGPGGVSDFLHNVGVPNFSVGYNTSLGPNYSIGNNPTVYPFSGTVDYSQVVYTAQTDAINGLAYAQSAAYYLPVSSSYLSAQESWNYANQQWGLKNYALGALSYTDAVCGDILAAVDIASIGSFSMIKLEAQVAEAGIETGIIEGTEQRHLIFNGDPEFRSWSIESAAKAGTNLVYEGIDAAGTVRYVGITERAAATRFAEHAASIGTGKENLIYRVVNGAEDLSRIDARVWEQTLINQYGLGKNGGLLLNKINSIAPKNWWQYGINP